MPVSPDDATLPPDSHDPLGATIAPAGDSEQTFLEEPSSLPELPGYVLERELGRGGMGVVYRARHVALNRVVAVKMILAGAHAGESGRGRFLAEAEAIAALDHPHIVKIFEIGEHSGLPYFTLEYCTGGSLADRVRDNPLSAAEAASVMEKVARGVAGAHAAGIVHRDLKPDNVLIAADGEPKVTDFGLAKRESGSGMTVTGAIMGTPSYMAPEQADGRSKEVGPAGDVWALGAVLYRLVTGRPPFQAATPIDTIMQVACAEPVRPRQLTPRLPADLETIILKCLRKEPSQRYASATALADDLLRFRAGEPIAARPVGRLERAWRWTRKNPVGAAAACLAAVVLAAVVVVPLVMAQREAMHSRVVEEEKRKALRQAAEATLDRALALCDHGESLHALAWMVRALELAMEAGDADVEEACRWNLGTWAARMPRPAHAWSVAPSDLGYLRSLLAFNPDGSLLAGADGKGLVHIWRTASGEPAFEPLAHPKRVQSLAFTPDGRTLLTGGEDGVARLWDTTTGKPRPITLAHCDPTAQPQIGWPPLDGVTTVAISPDGTVAATGGHDTFLRLWTLPDGKALGQTGTNGSKVLTARFSHDGQFVYAAAVSSELIRWSVSARAGLPVTRSPDWAVTGLMDGPPHFGSQSTVGVFGGKLYRIFPNGAVTPLETLRRIQMVNHGAASRDGRVIAVCSGPQAKVWDAVGGEPLTPALPHPADVTGLAVDPPGRFLASVVATEGVVRLWRLPEAWPTFEHRRGGWVTSLAFTPDGRGLAVGEHSAVTLFDVKSGLPTGLTYRADEGRVMGLTFSADGKRLYGGSENFRVYRWDAASGAEVGEAIHASYCVAEIDLSPDGSRLLTTTNAGGPGRPVVELWDTATARRLGRPVEFDGHRLGVAFSPDGKAALVPGAAPGNRLHLLDAQTGEPLATPRLTTAGPQSVAFHPGGQTVASADRIIRFWDLSTGEARGVPVEHKDAVLSLQFTHGGRLALSGSMDGTARFWHPATGKPVGPPLTHTAGLHAAVCSPDGRVAATGGSDSVARVWPAPVRMSGDLDEVRTRVRALTGIELGEERLIRVLEASAWHERASRLK